MALRSYPPSSLPNLNYQEDASGDQSGVQGDVASPVRLPPLPKTISSRLSQYDRKPILGEGSVTGFTPHPPPSSTKPKMASLRAPSTGRTRPSNDWKFQRHGLRGKRRPEPDFFWNQRNFHPPPQHKVDAATQRLLQPRRQRERFRKKLVDLIFCDEDGSKEIHHAENPSGGKNLTTLEKRKLRYYYYIHNGINTEHVAPLAESWINNVLHLVPQNLKIKWPVVVNHLCREIKDDYLFCVKKAISKLTSYLGLI